MTISKIDEYEGPRIKEKEFTDSSLIESVKYDLLMQTMIVKFKSKPDIYSYFDIPQSIAFGLFDSNSVGSYFSKNIKGKYAYHKKIIKQNENDQTQINEKTTGENVDNSDRKTL